MNTITSPRFGGCTLIRGGDYSRQCGALRDALVERLGEGTVSKMRMEHLGDSAAFFTKSKRLEAGFRAAADKIGLSYRTNEATSVERFVLTA